jgi:uncharacterized membrane protein YeaQ/YmgE (transglycosylase-associated protein family)
MTIALLILVAFAAGATGALLAGRSVIGYVLSIAAAAVGAFGGWWLAETLDLGTGPTFNDFQILWAVIGAAVFTVAFNTLVGRRTPE